MAEEVEIGNWDSVANDSVSIDDPQQSEHINLTIRLNSTSGRKCYVDSHEAFPQATYYLNSNLKRPNYYDRINRNEKQSKNKNSKANSKKKHKSPSLIDKQPNKLSKMEVDSDSNNHSSSEDQSLINDHDGNLADDDMNDNINHVDLEYPNPDRNSQSKLIADVGKNKITLDDLDTVEQIVKKKRKFGAWDGVFVSCLLNIFGVIMFLRLGFIVGQSGLWYTWLIILLSCVVTTLTTLSMAAIATNGEQRAGGAYYMISRTLGPAIGGSVGFLFAIGMSVAVSMYVIGFCETIVQQIGTITGDPSGTNDIRLYGSLLVTILLLVSVFGIGWVIRVQFLLLFVLILSMISFVIGAFQTKNVAGWTNGNLIDNFTPHFQPREGDEIQIDYNFFVCFAIFFPASTGIMAGANLSGDLKDPSRDIPLGTLTAIGVSTVVYMILALLLSATCTPDGLIYNYIIMSDVSIWSPLILFGIYAATLSSALTSLVGAPRILLSLSRDNLIPKMDYFSKTNADGEPIRAYIACYIIALGCVFIGHLNIVAPLITQFFLGTYAFISFACFSMSISHSPGWRPSFIYYNKYTALCSGVMCVAIMLFINIEYAVISIILAGVIYLYISYNKPNVNWGSAFASRAKWKANESSLRLYQYGDHVKNFQPSFLVLCKNDIFNTDGNHDTQSLIEYVLTLRHGFGTIVYSTVLLGAFEEHIDKISSKSAKNRGYYLPLAKKKAAFYEQVVASNCREGSRVLMQMTGIGRLRTNTVVLGWKTNWTHELIRKRHSNNNKAKKSNFSNDEYVGLLMDCLQMGMGFMVCRNLSALPFKFGRKYAQEGGMMKVAEMNGKDDVDQHGGGNGDNASSEDKIAGVIDESLSQSPYKNAMQFFHSDKEDDDDDDDADNGDSDDDGNNGDDDDDDNKDVELGDNKGNNNDEEVKEDSNLLVDDVAFDEALDDDDNFNAGRFSDAEATRDTQMIIAGLQPTTIDIWWLLDDGGLTLLVPHIMSLSRFWKKLSRKGRCRIRVFLVAEEDIVENATMDNVNKKDNKKQSKEKHNNNKREHSNKSSGSHFDIAELARISKGGLLEDTVLQTIDDSTELWKEELKALLNKFRLNILGPFTVKSARSEPTKETITKFCRLTRYNWNKTMFNGKKISDNVTLKRWLRVSELIHAYSRHQQCTMITAPFPLSFPSSVMYMGVCDLLTQNSFNSSILIRGSGQNCLTFYSE